MTQLCWYLQIQFFLKYLFHLKSHKTALNKILNYLEFLNSGSGITLGQY